MKKTMKCLGVGYIWFGWDKRALDYTDVSLLNKRGGSEGNKRVKIKMHELGACQKVRLWAELVK